MAVKATDYGCIAWQDFPDALAIILGLTSIEQTHPLLVKPHSTFKDDPRLTKDLLTRKGKLTLTVLDPEKLPDWVRTLEDEIIDKEDDGFPIREDILTQCGFSVNKMLIILFQAIQQQQAQIEELTTRIQQLESKVPSATI